MEYFTKSDWMGNVTVIRSRDGAEVFLQGEAAAKHTQDIKAIHAKYLSAAVDHMIDEYLSQYDSLMKVTA